MKSVAALAVMVVLIVLLGWGRSAAPAVTEAALSTEQCVRCWDQRVDSARRDLIRASAVHTERSDVVRLLRERIEAVERRRQVVRDLAAPKMN